ncbi:MAG: GldG family protein [Candidatus Firestonebacteria bacterium]
MKIKINFKDILSTGKTVLKSKTAKYGTNLTVFALVVVGIVIFVNVILSRHSFRHDFTVNKQFDLSGQTKKILKGLDKKIKITAFSKKGTYNDRMIKDMLEEYAQISKKIELDSIDPDSNPGKARQYGITTYNTVVFETGTGRKDVLEKDLFVYDYSNSYGGQQPPQFQGEQTFTAAIMSITQEGQKVIYFLKGHGERDVNDSGREGFSEAKKTLERENYVIKELDLATTTKISEDCQLLIVPGPKKGFAEKEIEIVEKYLAGGGKGLFMFDPGVNTGLEGMLKTYKIDIGNDLILDPASCYSGDAMAPIPAYKSHDITNELQKQRIGIILAAARSVSEPNGNSDGVVVFPLLETSDKGWAEKDLRTQKAKYDEGVDKKGPVTIAVAVTKTVTEGNTGSVTQKDKTEEMRMVVIGDSDFVTNKIMGIQGNVDFFGNSVNWILQEKEKIAIRPKTLELRKMDLSRFKGKFIFWVTVVLTPLSVLVCGITVWVKRRKK